MKLKFKPFFKFRGGGHVLRPSKRAYCGSKNFLATLLSKSSRDPKQKIKDSSRNEGCQKVHQTDSNPIPHDL